MHSKYAHRLAETSIILELVRNTESRAPHSTHGLRMCIFNKIPKLSVYSSKSEKHHLIFMFNSTVVSFDQSKILTFYIIPLDIMNFSPFSIYTFFLNSLEHSIWGSLWFSPYCLLKLLFSPSSFSSLSSCLSEVLQYLKLTLRD